MLLASVNIIHQSLPKKNINHEQDIQYILINMTINWMDGWTLLIPNWEFLAGYPSIAHEQ